MPAELPTWSHAEVIVSHGGLTVGVFPSTKPWMPRYKECRFFAADDRPLDPNETPAGGTPLKSLLDGANGTIEHRGFVVLAGEAEGHRSVALLAGGDGWTAVIAADAWIVLGPQDSAPQALEIGPHTLDLTHLQVG